MFRDTEASLSKLSSTAKSALEKLNGNTHIQLSGVSLMDVLLANCFDLSELNIVTFRISKKDINTIKRIAKKNKAIEIKILISDSVRSMTPAAYNALIASRLGFIEINTHAKMIFLRKVNGGVISAFSSGNLNPDGKIEQISVCENQEKYKSFKKWINKLWQEAKGK